MQEETGEGQMWKTLLAGSPLNCKRRLSTCQARIQTSQMKVPAWRRKTDQSVMYFVRKQRREFLVNLNSTAENSHEFTDAKQPTS